MLKKIKEIIDGCWFVWFVNGTGIQYTKMFVTEGGARKYAEEVSQTHGVTAYVYRAQEVARVKSRTQFDWASK